MKIVAYGNGVQTALVLYRNISQKLGSPARALHNAIPVLVLAAFTILCTIPNTAQAKDRLTNQQTVPASLEGFIDLTSLKAKSQAKKTLILCRIQDSVTGTGRTKKSGSIRWKSFKFLIRKAKKQFRRTGKRRWSKKLKSLRADRRFYDEACQQIRGTDTGCLARHNHRA